MQASVPKPLLMLGKAPIIVRTLEVFDTLDQIAGLVLVVHEDYIGMYQDAVKAAGLKKPVDLIPGGKTRTQSVRLGLARLDADTDTVIIHDAVRPFATRRMIEEGLDLTRKYKAVVAGVPVKPTIKVVDPKTGLIRETLDRSLVWEIQTPQIFSRQLLDRAYHEDAEATDDAGMVERLGVEVKAYKGDYRNIKITTPEDMLIAEALMKDRRL